MVWCPALFINIRDGIHEFTGYNSDNNSVRGRSVVIYPSVTANILNLPSVSVNIIYHTPVCPLASPLAHRPSTTDPTRQFPTQAATTPPRCATLKSSSLTASTRRFGSRVTATGHETVTGTAAAGSKCCATSGRSFPFAMRAKRRMRTSRSNRSNKN